MRKIHGSTSVLNFFTDSITIISANISRAEKGNAIDCTDGSLKNSFLLISRNHLCGNSAVTQRKNSGIFSIGNMKPENIMLGKSPAAIAICIAACCCLVITEISSPSANAPVM